jgi:hypothetical protein
MTSATFSAGARSSEVPFAAPAQLLEMLDDRFKVLNYGCRKCSFHGPFNIQSLTGSPGRRRD